jgi:hypothetical protein
LGGAVLDLAGDGARGVEVTEGVALLLGEGIDGLDAGELGRGQLREPRLRLKLLLLQHLDLLVRAALLQRHRLDIHRLRNGLHLIYKEVMIKPN